MKRREISTDRTDETYEKSAYRKIHEMKRQSVPKCLDCRRCDGPVGLLPAMLPEIRSKITVRRKNKSRPLAMAQR